MPVVPPSAISWAMGKRARTWGHQILDCTSRNQPQTWCFSSKNTALVSCLGVVFSKSHKSKFLHPNIIEFGARIPGFYSLNTRPPDAPNCTTLLMFQMFPAAEKWQQPGCRNHQLAGLLVFNHWAPIHIAKIFSSCHWKSKLTRRDDYSLNFWVHTPNSRYVQVFLPTSAPWLTLPSPQILGREAGRSSPLASSTQHLSPLSSRHWTGTGIRNAPTQALAPRFCAMGLNFFSLPRFPF